MLQRVLVTRHQAHRPTKVDPVRHPPLDRKVLSVDPRAVLNDERDVTQFQRRCGSVQDDTGRSEAGLPVVGVTPEQVGSLGGPSQQPAPRSPSLPPGSA